jgi:alpha-amylase/alpha-mannosidase (GH57 family)
MTRVHLAILWHMHQPQYRDPSSGSYVLPWTRLHALKDYWGMVKVLEEFPGVHATINIVPSLAAQLEEYASGKFDEPWFRLAFARTDSLSSDQRREVLERAFQVNRENLMSRFPRFVELFEWAQAAGINAAAQQMTVRDLRDLQVLSQLVWMDEEYLADDSVVSALARKGHNFTEEEKQQLRTKQFELLVRVLPDCRRAGERGQIELSTTPYYHPILPLLCDTDVARISNPSTPLPQPPFRFPGDARVQLDRARASHERLFGRLPAGLWPSEGSVSDQVLDIAAELGFRWFATDEGVLGRTLGVGFWRDPSGFPENADKLYSLWRIRMGGREIVGFFRDHYLSDLIGFVYSRMDAAAAAEDLHHRIRVVGERVRADHPPTVSLILDGENAWEWYPGNGREFLRQFYRRIEGDSEIRAITMTEAVDAHRDLLTLEGIFPASWINANFDIWIGHPEDVRAWDLLRDARGIYEEEKKRHAAGGRSISDQALARAYESLLAAEGSDWCWWYGPEHSSSNDQEFDALYRKHLTESYVALGREAPDVLAQPIKRPAERPLIVPPQGYLKVRVDGRESTYFEWLGAGCYGAGRAESAMHGRASLLRDFFYGFGDQQFFVRVDFDAAALRSMRDADFRITIQAQEELRVIVNLRAGILRSFSLERKDACVLNPGDTLLVAIDKILEIALARELFSLAGQRSFRLGVALWQAGLPVDALPTAGPVEVALGEEASAWPIE